MPPPLNPEVPREMAARHRRERRQLRTDRDGSLDEYMRLLREMWDRQARERDGAFSPDSEGSHP